MMMISARAPRVRRGVTLVTLAALVGGGLALPVASSAFAAPIAAATTPELPTAPLVTTGTEWHYLDTAVDPSAGGADRNSWTAPDFADDAWAVAPGAFGVKGNKLAAVGPYTPKTKLQHYINDTAAPTVPTYFFRTSFELAEGAAAQIGAVKSEVIYDDALRVYVNGEKVAGFVDERVDDANPSNLQYAGNSAGDPAKSTFAIDPALLHDGTNTIAVALYQDRESSSDAYFDMTSLTLQPKNEDGSVDPVAAAPSRVILTPTETPTTSQSFSWMAGDAGHTIGQVEIGAVGDAAAGSAPASTRVIDAYEAGKVNGNLNPHFSATVADLEPATDYRYRVGLPGAWSEWFDFTTADPSDTDFQFVYYGDAQIGLDTTWPSVVQQAEAKATDSIGSVHAGDLINTGSNDVEWQNWFKGMERSATSTNVMAAPGNHEYSGDKLLQSWKAHFEYPLNQPGTETIGDLAALAQGDTDAAKQYAAYFERWAEFAAETVYFTDYQGVRFITLNATRDTTFLKPDNLPACTGTECPSGKVQELWTEYQAAWLDYVLKNSASKWNVVTFHQPVYSTSSGRDEAVLRKHWVPVFEENNIDLVLMGHDHTYGRGYNTADLTDTSGLTTGPVYAVSNSGAKHYDLETEEKNVWTNNGAIQRIRAQDVTTYQVIDVTEDQLTYRSYVAERPASAQSFTLTDASGERPVYTEKAVPQVGELFDEFTVTKYATDTKWVTEPGVDAPAGPELTLGATEVQQGADLTIAGTGFTPESELKVELHSDPVELGTATVDADGAFSTTVTIPADAATDTPHELVVVLPNGKSVSTPLTVTAAAPVEPGGGTDGGTDGGADGGSGSTDGSGSGSAGGSGSGSGSNGTATNGAPGLANTGAAGLLPLGVAGALLLAAGVAVVIRRRQRASA
ncbi:metallophosphoesterase [Leucobacter sp. cx-42]|nr:metallophosphoesterase [Leucobacter sp. cx-42]